MKRRDSSHWHSTEWHSAGVAVGSLDVRRVMAAALVRRARWKRVARVFWAAPAILKSWRARLFRKS